MSAALDLLSRLKADGLTIGVHDGRLDIRGPEQALERLPVSELQRHKAELLQLAAEEIRPPSAPAPLPGIAALEERAAIVEYDGGMPRLEAECTAARELGFANLREFYAAHLECWRAAVAAVTVWRAGSDCERPYAQACLALRNASLEFLSGQHALEAVRGGWVEPALFGVHEGPKPLERLDGRGLIAVIALSCLGLKLVRISATGAALTNARGATLHQPRFRHSHNAAYAWWRHPLLARGEP